MSDQPGSNADRAPQSKRQKRGDGVEEAFGGPMYDEPTARKMLKEVVLVSAENAEDGEAVIGFDPDDTALDNLYFVDDGNFEGMEVTPMVYFAQMGDIKMCRYLVSRGASTTNRSEELGLLFPMLMAAQEGHLNICMLLYVNGAQNDVRRTEKEGWTPFLAAAAYFSQYEVARWLVLQGALCADASSQEIEKYRLYPTDYGGDNNRKRMANLCQLLVEWAEEVTQTHSAFVMFLLGTLPPAPDKKQSRTLQCLSGHPGVRNHIGDFVGLEVTKRTQLGILRSVIDVFPSFIDYAEV